MGKLLNINDLKTKPLDCLNSNLTANVFVELFNQQIFFTSESLNVFSGSNTKKKIMLNPGYMIKDIYPMLFANNTKESIQNYYNRESVDIKSGLYINDDLTFKDTKNLKWFYPIEIVSENIPEYFIVEKKVGGNYKIVHFHDLKLSGLYDMIQIYLDMFKNLKIIEQDGNLGTDYMYKLFGFDIINGTKKLVSTTSKSANLCKIGANQSSIFKSFGDNNIVHPNIFNFVFNFNDDTFLLDDVDDYRAYFSKTYESGVEIDLDFEQFIDDYKLPKNIFSRNAPELNDYVLNNIKPLKSTKEIIIPKHPKIKNCIKTKYNLYGVEVLEGNMLFNMNIDRFSIGEICGFEGLTNVKNPTIIKDKIYSNIKLTFSSTIGSVFSNSDYISFQSELLKENNNKDIIEWRLYASEMENCNCTRNKNGCFQPGYISKFESLDVLQETNGYEITVGDYIELSEGDTIYFTTNTGFCGTGIIYKIRNSFGKNTTKFNLYTSDIDLMLSGGIKFEYFQKPFYYTFFNKNGNPSNVAKSIQASIFMAFIDKNFPVDCVVDDNSIVFMNKFAQNNFNTISMNYRFHSKTSLDNFLINDTYKLKPKHVDDKYFKFGNVQFTGSHLSNNPISFIINKDNIIDDDYEFILTKQGMVEINKYKANNDYIRHFNYILNGEVIDNYYGYCVENFNKNNDFYIKDNTLFLSKRFRPQILNLLII